MNERIYYSQDAERRAQRDRLSLALMVTTLGIGIGAVLALLFAPQRGELTRQQLSEQLERAAAQGQDSANGAVKNLRNEVDELRKMVTERIEATRR